MPPSGYTPKQTEFIVDFLQSCAQSLIEEAHLLSLTPVEALRREVSNIDVINSSTKSIGCPEFVLGLTKWFYASIAESLPDSTPKYEQAVESTLTRIKEEITNIHVPSIGADS